MWRFVNTNEIFGEKAQKNAKKFFRSFEKICTKPLECVTIYKIKEKMIIFARFSGGLSYVNYRRRL
jgi:hypothetical protein